jgi:transcriptional regulator with XRE-family HTH domain
MKKASAANGVRWKIARLVQERGWNQEEFARFAGVSRLTVRGIFQTRPRQLQNATLAKCARALNVSVYDLCELPLENLLHRGAGLKPASHAKHHSYKEATQPELLAWIRDKPERAARLSPEERDELLSLQGTGGPLTAQGVDYFVELIERKRRLQEKIAAIAGTEHIDLLEQFVNVLYTKIQPYRDRKTK